VALAPRPVTIELLRLLAWDPASGRLELEVRCSAGTYIRALARDLGEGLGCGGALASLRRTAALGFDLEGAVPLERLASGPPPLLRDPLEALGHLARRRLSPAELPGWRCGRALQTTPPVGEAEPPAAGPIQDSGDPDGTTEPPPPVAILRPDGSLAGIAQPGPEGQLHPRLVFDAAG